MAELYKFTDGVRSVGFSPHFRSESYLGVDYVATAVTRSALNLSGNLVKSQVTFTFPNTTEFAKRKVFDLPGEAWVVEILEDYEVFWTGRVIEATLNGSTISIVADSSEKSGARNPTGARFSPFCWKTLYSANCGVDKASVRTPLTVTITGTTVTLPTAQIFNAFAGGVLEIYGGSSAEESRGITGNEGTSLTLSSPFESLASGTMLVAWLYPGCNLTWMNCFAFNNTGYGSRGNSANFGGFEFIPTSNPMERTGLI
jgi:hypothetical protein